MEESKFYSNNFCFYGAQTCQVLVASVLGPLSPVKLQRELGELSTVKNDAHHSSSPPVLSGQVRIIHRQPGKPAFWTGEAATHVFLTLM